MLAIDQGGQSTRAAVFDSSGQLVESAKHGIVTHRPKNFWVEHSAEEILQSVYAVLARLGRSLGESSSRIVSAAFAGQGSSFLCWDKQTGQALTPVISWQDTRADQKLKEILASLYNVDNELSHEDLVAITGLRLLPYYGASKIHWCLENEPAVREANKAGTLSIGPIASFIFHRLNLLDEENNASPRSSGPNSSARHLKIDPGHAQRTFLWDLNNNAWSSKLLNLFGVAESSLPACVDHQSQFATVSVGNMRVPLNVSMRDQGASLFAQGTPSPNCYYVNLGTGGFLQRISRSNHAPDGILVSPLWFAGETRLYAWEAPVNGVASSISSLETMLDVTITPELINQAVLESLGQSQHNSLYFINTIGGLAAPYWRDDLDSIFAGEVAEGVDPLHAKINAWIESIVFLLAVNVRLIDSALGRVELIKISGGFSQYDGLCQVLANVLHRQVTRAECAEATLAGSAYCAASMPENWNLKSNVEEEGAAKCFVPVRDKFVERRFELWRVALLESMIMPHRHLPLSTNSKLADGPRT